MPAYDESRTPDGRPREGYERLLANLGARDLTALADGVEDFLEHYDVSFGVTAFRVDPVPRLIRQDEWAPLRAGLIQRARALDRFVADVYGARRSIADGVVPAAAVASAEFLEPGLVHALAEQITWISIAGLDVVRCPDGAFQVLEDNVRTPSGVVYALAARRAIIDQLDPPEAERPVPIEPSFAILARVLRDAAPEGVDEPTVAIITDGESNVAFFEHRTLAERLGVMLVTADQLELRHGELIARTEGAPTRIDVLYRRTDEDRLHDPRGGLTGLGELLAGPWTAGRLGLVNGFGTGVADDKLVHAHVEDLIRYFLGEEPLLNSVPTYDLDTPSRVERVLGRLDELVVKPRAGHGGQGVVIGPLATPDELDHVASELRRAPEEYIVQQTVMLSQHPTVCEGELKLRHVDLRPFVFLSKHEAHVVPGGLTRVAFEEGELIVNSSRNGGAKDTWVLP